MAIPLINRVISALSAVDEKHLRDRAPPHLQAEKAAKSLSPAFLAVETEALILDEPTSNLHPAGRRELVELLAGLDSTQLVVSHDLPFALELCPRAAILDQGKIVADGPTQDLFGDRELMQGHRLELPYGFDPANIAAR